MMCAMRWTLILMILGFGLGLAACAKRAAEGGKVEEAILSGVKQDEKKIELEVPTRPPRAPEEPDAMPKVSLPPPD